MPDKIDRDIISDNIKRWVIAAAGDFSVNDLDRDLGHFEEDERTIRTEVLEGLVRRGELDRVGVRRGWYRRVDRTLDKINWRNASTKEFDIRLPFNLSKFCRIYPKNLIGIAGEKNSGKTSVGLNIVKDNMNRGHEIYYFSSEMDETEFKIRLESFEDVHIEDWNFEPVDRTSDFEDVIQPDAINIVDYFEISDNFFRVAGHLKNIYQRLNKGIAIIMAQKDPKSENARGGEFFNEKPRLTFNLVKRFDPQTEKRIGSRVKVTNCKFPRTGMPGVDGLSLDFNIWNGSQINIEYDDNGHSWSRED